jgi:protein XagA
VNRFIKRIAGSLFITGILISFAAGTCFAGAWTIQKGKIYDRLAVNYYFADREFNSEGHRNDLADNGKFRDYNINNYIEFGLTDKITVINSLYFKKIEKEDDVKETKTYGIGDIDLGVKYKLAEGTWGIFSSQALVKIPEAYDANDDLPLGNGQYDLELRLLYGRSLYPAIPGYCNFEVGYRWRLDDPSDEIRYLIEVGIDITKSLYGRAKLDGTYSMDNGEHFDESGNPTTTNNFDIGKLDLTLGYKINKSWAIEAGYMPAIYGQNIAAGATYTIAVSFSNN